MGIDFFKKTWLTSDWHLGHKNVLNFCHQTRKFNDINEMAEVLIHNYNKHVKPDDVCYFLGDVAFKGSTHHLNCIARLNGTKILVRGNHDKGHLALLDLGFAAVVDQVAFKVAGFYITASHFPLAGIRREKTEMFNTYIAGDHWHGESKCIEKFIVLEDVGQDIHLHGHIHSPNNGNSKKIQGIQYDVGVDANGLTPVSLKHIVKQIGCRQASSK